MTSDTTSPTVPATKPVSISGLLSSLKDFQARAAEVAALQSEASTQHAEARAMIEKAEGFEVDSSIPASKAAGESSKLRQVASILQTRGKAAAELAAAENSRLVTDIQAAREELLNEAHRRHDRLLAAAVEAFGKTYGEDYNTTESARDLLQRLDPLASVGQLTASRISGSEPRDGHAALTAFEEELELAKPLDGLQNVRLELKLVR